MAGNPCDNYTQIAFDADYEFYQANGSSVPSTVADIENILDYDTDALASAVGGK